MAQGNGGSFHHHLFKLKTFGLDSLMQGFMEVFSSSSSSTSSSGKGKVFPLQA